MKERGERANYYPKAYSHSTGLVSTNAVRMFEMRSAIYPCPVVTTISAKVESSPTMWGIRCSGTRVSAPPANSGTHTSSSLSHKGSHTSLKVANVAMGTSRCSPVALFRSPMLTAIHDALHLPLGFRQLLEGWWYSLGGRGSCRAEGRGSAGASPSQDRPNCTTTPREVSRLRPRPQGVRCARRRVVSTCRWIVPATCRGRNASRGAHSDPCGCGKSFRRVSQGRVDRSLPVATRQRALLSNLIPPTRRHTIQIYTIAHSGSTGRGCLRTLSVRAAAPAVG